MMFSGLVLLQGKRCRLWLNVLLSCGAIHCTRWCSVALGPVWPGCRRPPAVRPTVRSPASRVSGYAQIRPDTSEYAAARPSAAPSSPVCPSARPSVRLRRTCTVEPAAEQSAHSNAFLMGHCAPAAHHRVWTREMRRQRRCSLKELLPRGAGDFRRPPAQCGPQAGGRHCNGKRPLTKRSGVPDAAVATAWARSAGRPLSLGACRHQQAARGEELRLRLC